MTSRLSDTEKSLPIMLLRAREAVMKRFRPLLKSHGISEQQWRVLRVLNELGPQEPAQLAERCVILAPSLTRILRALELQNYISRDAHNNDGRKMVVTISAGGKKLIGKITPPSVEIYAGIEDQFGPERLHNLMAALRELSVL